MGRPVRYTYKDILIAGISDGPQFRREVGLDINIFDTFLRSNAMGLHKINRGMPIC